MIDQVFHTLGLIVVASPAGLVALLGVPALIARPLSEQATNRLTYLTTILGLLASLAVLALMLAMNTRNVAIDLGEWVIIPEQHFHFHLKFIFDRLSVPFVILTFLLCGTVGAFTSRYLHREPGFNRFYICYSLSALSDL